MNKDELIKALLEKVSESDLADILDKQEKDIEELEVVVQEQPQNVHSIKSSSRSSSRGGKKQKHKKGGKKNRSSKRSPNADKGEACRVEPMRITSNRPNDFEQLIANAPPNANEQEELDRAKEMDKKTKVIQKRPRSNPMIDVVCRICKEEFEVSPALVANRKRWKCNSCSTTGAY